MSGAKEEFISSKPFSSMRAETDCTSFISSSENLFASNSSSDNSTKLTSIAMSDLVENPPLDNWI